MRQLSTVYLPVLLLDLAYSSILTNTSFYTSYLGLSSTFLGVLMAVTTAFFVVLAIPFGRLSDRIERRYVPLRPRVWSWVLSVSVSRAAEIACISC